MTAAQPGKTPDADDQAEAEATARALATIDLSGGDETPASTVGRVAIGLLLLIVGGAVALAMFAAYVAGAFIPAIADIVDLMGDFLLYLCVIPLGVAITGFTLIRRNRKARAAEAKESAELIARLGAAGALTGTATPETIEAALGGPRTGDMDVDMQRPLPGTPGGPVTGSETHL
jgi:hypothetical protein